MLRALIVDDEKPARDELMYLLSAHPDVEAAEAATASQALAAIEAGRPDVVLCDIHMNALTLVFAALCVFAIGYRFYGLFFARKVLGVNDARLTPAVTMRAWLKRLVTRPRTSPETRRPGNAASKSGWGPLPNS